MCDYEESPRVSYGDADDEFGIGVFIRVCPHCGRFVKAPEKAQFFLAGGAEAKSECSKCGEIELPFEGYF